MSVLQEYTCTILQLELRASPNKQRNTQQYVADPLTSSALCAKKRHLHVIGGHFGSLLQLLHAPQLCTCSGSKLVISHDQHNHTCLTERLRKDMPVAARRVAAA